MNTLVLLSSDMDTDRKPGIWCISTQRRFSVRVRLLTILNRSSFFLSFLFMPPHSPSFTVLPISTKSIETRATGLSLLCVTVLFSWSFVTHVLISNFLPFFLHHLYTYVLNSILPNHFRNTDFIPSNLFYPTMIFIRCRHFYYTCSFTFFAVYYGYTVLERNRNRELFERSIFPWNPAYCTGRFDVWRRRKKNKK